MEQKTAWKRKTLLFLAGQCVTLFGSSVVQFAIVWYVTRETGSGVWVSALSICSFVPQMLISPAAAGALLTVSTLRSALYIDIATAAVGMGLLAAIVLPPQVRAEDAAAPALGAELRAGVRYAFSDRFLSRLLPLYGVFIFLCVPAGFLATLFVGRTYGDSYVNLAIVELVGFAGMAGGGLLLSVWGGFRNQVKTLLVGLAAFGALAVGMGAVHSFPFYLALMAIYGVALTMVQTSTTTLIQLHAAPALQGRVFGLLNALYCGFLPLGMAVFGPLSDHMPMEGLMILSGAALLALAAAFRAQPAFYKGGIKEAASAEEEKPV